MTTEERLENLERELARAKRRNRRLLICAAVCLGMIFAWAFFAQPGPLGTAQASDPANPYEAEIARLQAEVNLLKRENERLRKELEEAKKDKSAAAPTDAQGPSAAQPAATEPPGQDKPPTADRIPGLPENDSSWWRDPDPVALAKHMYLRAAISATKPQASVWMWLQRNNYFAEQPLQWEVTLDNIYNVQDNNSRSAYVNKDNASIEYYKCLAEVEKIGKEGVSKDEIVARAAWFRGEAKAWKILMDAGGGVSVNGSTSTGQVEADLPVFRVHLVFPWGRPTGDVVLRGPDGKPVPLSTIPYSKVRVQGKIIALAFLTGPSGVSLHATLTGKVTAVYKGTGKVTSMPPQRETVEEHEAAQRALEGRPPRAVEPAAPAVPSRVEPTAPDTSKSERCPFCGRAGGPTGEIRTVDGYPMRVFMCGQGHEWLKR
jgi:cell division protein FtsB